MLELTPGQHIHFIGIGGAGLSAIARILLQRGFTISGSDLNQSAVTAELAADGARFFHGHSGAYIAGADLVLASSAVPAGHVEMVAARESGIPIYKRQEFMAPLLGGKDTIAVAGTHGKTTTTLNDRTYLAAGWTRSQLYCRWRHGQYRYKRRRWRWINVRDRS